MSIGYAVEGSSDRALLEGLRRRWCPEARLIKGTFRGQTRESLRREIPKICLELDHKGAEAIVFLTDANNQDWKAVKKRESDLVPLDFQHVTLYGVAERNVECWLSADRDYLARKLGLSRESLDKPDPKGDIESALGITRDDKKGEEIAAIVQNAPLGNWLDRSPSFATFYEDAVRLGKQMEHPLPNEREKAR